MRRGGLSLGIFRRKAVNQIDVRELGGQSEESFMRRPVNSPWSESEVAKLRALAQKRPIPDLVKELRRSRGAISAKAFSLRLSLDVRKGPFVDNRARARARKRI